MRHLFVLAVIAVALTSTALGQPAWGPVYQWGQAAGAAGKPAGYFKQVSTGLGYTIGLRPNGSIAVWGTEGDIPGLDGPHHNVLDTGLPAAGTWVSIRAGYEEAIALNSDGTVYVWGYDYGPYCNGELTLDDCDDCRFTAVAAGENMFVGIVDSGRWGPRRRSVCLGRRLLLQPGLIH